MEELVLQGGVANAGDVVRRGNEVLRPRAEHADTIRRFLSSLHAVGFHGVPRPIGVADDGRERLVFIPGDVALPPFPHWVQEDVALRSITRLLRSFHDASRHFDRAGATWNHELSDPEGGPVICHNDVCLENVVFGDGSAVALLDFDLTAPGRPTWDLARFAAMCVPLDDQSNAERQGWKEADRAARLKVVADAYGLSADERRELLSILDHQLEQSGEWVLAKVEAGDPHFTKMWEDMGGHERHRRRRAWWAASRPQMAAALR